MSGLKFAQMYLDDLLCLSTGDLDDHLEKLEVILRCLQKVGLKCNTTKSAFCATQIEYLGYWLTRDRIKPLPNKVEAIFNLGPVQLSSFQKRIDQSDSLLIYVKLMTISEKTLPDTKNHWHNAETWRFPVGK